MVDISSLGNLESAKPLDLSIYPDARGGQGLPKSGRFVVRAPESFSASAFSKTRAGNLSARVDPTIVGPSDEGYTLRFTNISAKVYQRDGKDVSQVGDYLRSFGITEELTGDPQQAANLIASTAGQTYEIFADWEARHSATGYKVTGMKNFPTDTAGNPQSWVEHPAEVDGEGKALRLRANLVVRKFLPKA